MTTARQLIVSEMRSLLVLLGDEDPQEAPQEPEPVQSRPKAHAPERQDGDEPERNGKPKSSLRGRGANPPKQLLPPLQSLAAGPQRAGDIVTLMGVTGPNVFRHLMIDSPYFRQQPGNRLSPWELTPEGEAKLKELEK